MISLVINQSSFVIKEGLSILEACKLVGVQIPRFCYHESLSISGNCRMCLVKLEADDDKLILACLTEIAQGMEIISEDPIIEKAREEVLEFLLLDHPLDCPICDQGGECDLQDQSKRFGSFYNKFFINKVSPEDKSFNVFVKGIMSRCIHCTRCVRFSNEIAGYDLLGTLNRGNSTEIGGYLMSAVFQSELSGNIIDLCPVGALTSKPYAFKHRPWELQSVETIDITDGLGSNIYANFSESAVVRIMPKYNVDINENFISDKARFSYDSFQKQGSGFIKISKGKKVSKSVIDNFELFSKPFFDKHLFVLSDDINFESIALLKSSSYKQPQISICSSASSLHTNKNNIFINYSNRFASAFKAGSFCFLVALNPRTEIAVMNARLRFLQVHQVFNIYNIGCKFDSLAPAVFINFNPSNLTALIEGRAKSVSRFLVVGSAPLLVFGSSLSSRGFCISSIKATLKSVNPSTIFLSVFLHSNSSGVFFFNIKSLNTKLISNSKSVSFLSCHETSFLRKVFLNKRFSAPFFWFNTHSSKGIVYNGFDIFVRNAFQENATYLNLEFRPQKAHKCFGASSNSVSYSNFFNTLFHENKFAFFKTSFYSFLGEILTNGSKFNGLCSTKYLTALKACFFPKLFNASVNCHPFKPKIGDFFKTSQHLEGSFNMRCASKAFMKSFNNFY